MKTMRSRASWAWLRLLPPVIALAATAWLMAQEPPSSSPLSPVDLVRRTVQNEIAAAGDPVKYMFRDRKETPGGSQTKLMVETVDAMAGMVVAINDRPLSPEQRQGEIRRIERFVSSPDELRKKQKQEKENSERVLRIVKALPDAFIYEYDGTEASTPGVGKPGDELVRLKFRPNPRYDPPSRVEQVLTGMHGYLLIDKGKERIAKIDGTLANDVSFGWGILGHLDRGGHFEVEQAELNKGYWEITRTILSLTGKILFFKSLTIKSTEVYSGFQPVPANLTFAQGVELLKKQEAAIAENHESSNQPQ